jgi:hypothetical protein
MPDVDLIDGPKAGQTIPIDDGEWPQEILHFDGGVDYKVDDVEDPTPTAHEYTVPVSGGGDDPLDAEVGPPGDQGPAGPPGPTGPPGADGEDGIAVGLNWMDEWAAGITYSPYDGVTHEGSSYYTEETVDTDIEPPAAPWRLLAAKGADGDPGGGGGTEGAMVWMGTWAAGSYPAGSVVIHDGRTWVAEVDTVSAPTEGDIPDPPTLDTVPSTWIDGDSTVGAAFVVEGSSPYRSPTYFGATPVEAVAFETDGTIVAGDYINVRQGNNDGANVFKMLADAPAGSDPVYEGGDLTTTSTSNSFSSLDLAPNRRYILMIGARNTSVDANWEWFFSAPAKIKDMSIPSAVDWTPIT